jgi:hypothetical protein
LIQIIIPALSLAGFSYIKYNRQTTAAKEVFYLIKLWIDNYRKDKELPKLWREIICFTLENRYISYPVQINKRSFVY